MEYQMKKLLFLSFLITFQTLADTHSQLDQKVLNKCSKKSKEYVKNLNSQKARLGDALLSKIVCEYAFGIQSGLYEIKDESENGITRLLTSLSCKQLEYFAKNKNLIKIDDFNNQEIDEMIDTCDHDQ